MIQRRAPASRQGFIDLFTHSLPHIIGKKVQEYHIDFTADARTAIFDTPTFE